MSFIRLIQTVTKIQKIEEEERALEDELMDNCRARADQIWPIAKS